MPNKTKMLDYGGFVHSPETPPSADFAEYLRQIDLLATAWQGASEQWNQSQFSAELLQRKKEAQRAFDDFAAAYQDKYTIKQVERDPTFLPVAKFFARYRPIRRSFSILHCNLDLPLHTVYAFENDADLAAANAALGKVTPLRWWQDGPSNHPCYLFGDWIWELKPTELNASDRGLTLLFETTTEKDRLQRDRLRHDLVGVRSSGPADEQFISEAVRASVWRRDGGKCARCGGRDGIDFSVVSPSLRGNTPAAQNVQLLCAKCRAKQS
jgi:hypothetical protein